MKDNKGVSLVELIVVIAIMAVLTGLVSVSYRLVWGTYAKECAKNIESQLNSAKVTAMGKKNLCVRIYRDTDKAYYAQLVEFEQTTDGSGAPVLHVSKATDTKKVGRKSIKVAYSCDRGATRVPLAVTDSSAAVGAIGSEGTDLYILYDRSSGAFSKSPISGNCCTDIWITQGTKELHLKLYEETGKVELE